MSNKTRITVNLHDEALAKRLRHAAITCDRAIAAIVAESVYEWLRRYKPEPQESEIHCAECGRLHDGPARLTDGVKAQAHLNSLREIAEGSDTAREESAMTAHLDALEALLAHQEGAGE